MDENDVRARLERLAGTEAPPARVDIGLALRRGRRRLRWRRAGLSGTPVAAVVVIAVIAGGIIPAGSGHAHPAAPAARPVPPKSFNPLIPYAAFGPLPAGESLIAGTIERTNEYLVAGPGSQAKWALTVYASGRCNLSSRQVLRLLRSGHHPELNCSTSSSGGFSAPVIRQAPSVNGQLAFLGQSYLAWEYARGSWATLSGPGPHPRTGEIVKIADGIRYAVATKPSIKFPVELTGVPLTSRISAVHFVSDAGILRASDYDVSGAGGFAPNFTTDPATRHSSCYFYPHGQSRHETINGYRVTVNHFKAGRSGPAEQQVCAADADGLSVFISTFHSGRSAPDAVAIFARHMKLLGKNPANWTTKPLG